MKILYLEDDINLSQAVKELLYEEGFDTVCVYDGEEALETIYKENFDIFLLDVNVPKLNGFQLLKDLRDANISTPAIFTTSFNSINDLANGYDSGADDYLKKPFELEELLFRIKALLKREYKDKEELVLITKGVYFNTQTDTLIVKNKNVLLNPKEILLLKLLLKSKNECVSFENIYQSVWSCEDTHSEMSLRTYVKNLRKHIGKENIFSIKKVGYKLI